MSARHAATFLEWISTADQIAVLDYILTSNTPCVCIDFVQSVGQLQYSIVSSMVVLYCSGHAGKFSSPQLLLPVPPTKRHKPANIGQSVNQAHPAAYHCRIIMCLCETVLRSRGGLEGDPLLELEVGFHVTNKTPILRSGSQGYLVKIPDGSAG